MYSPVFASSGVRHRPGASLYQQTDANSGALSASPHQLVTMLFDGLLQAISEARGALVRNDIATRGEAIGRALRIMNEGLKEGIVGRGDSELADNVFALYSYMSVRLMQANLHTDDAPLVECQSLVRSLREGWVAIAPQADHVPV